MLKTTFENVIVDVTVTAQAMKEIRWARDMSLSKINRMETAKNASWISRLEALNHACPTKSILDIVEMHHWVQNEGEGEDGFIHK